MPLAVQEAGGLDMDARMQQLPLSLFAARAKLLLGVPASDKLCIAALSKMPQQHLAEAPKET